MPVAMSAETGRMTHNALRGSLPCLAEKTLRAAARSVSAFGLPFVALGVAWLDGPGAGLGGGRLSGLCVDTAAKSASTDSMCKESSGSAGAVEVGVCLDKRSDEGSVVGVSIGASSSSRVAGASAGLPSPAARLASSAFFSASMSRLKEGSVSCWRVRRLLGQPFPQRNHPLGDASRNQRNHPLCRGRL